MTPWLLLLGIATQDAGGPAPDVAPPEAAPAVVAAYDFSSPVVDLAELLPEERERDLVQALRAHREASGVAVGVIVLDSLQGRPLFAVSHAASARLQEGFARGLPHVAIVVAPRERVLRLEIGHDLEERFADRAGERLVNQALRTFKAGDGPGAVTTLAMGVMEQTRGGPPSRGARAFLLALGAGCAVGLFGLMILRARRRP